MKDSYEKDSKKKYDAQERNEAPAKKQEELVNFDAWFTMKCSEKRKVAPHHYETLQAFFKKQGLKENEAATKYDAALKTFGF